MAFIPTARTQRSPRLASQSARSPSRRPSSHDPAAITSVSLFSPHAQQQQQHWAHFVCLSPEHRWPRGKLGASDEQRLRATSRITVSDRPCSLRSQAQAHLHVNLLLPISPSGFPSISIRATLAPAHAHIALHNLEARGPTRASMPRTISAGSQCSRTTTRIRTLTIAVSSE